MKSLKIEFAKTGARLVVDDSVEDRDATVQACLVNVATVRGSDPAHPARGTDLLRRAVGGLLISDQEAMHAANFAAVDTLFFVRANEHAGGTHDKVTAIVTRPMFVDRLSLSIDLKFVFASGAEIGTAQPLRTNE